jgi:CSLREA domain-containing protein
MRLRTGAATALLVTTAALAPAGPVSGFTTFVVNRTGDAPDSNLANSTCDTEPVRGNQCTLRAAIEEANDTTGPDTILLRIKSSSIT